MRQLKRTIEDIKNVYQEDLDFTDDFLPHLTPELKNIKEGLRKCIDCYYYQYFGEDYERFPININEYRTGSRMSYRFNDTKIEEFVGYNNFIVELRILVRNHVGNYEKDIESLVDCFNSDFKISKSVLSKLKELEQSIISLVNLDLNKIQKVIAKEYSEGYLKLFKKLFNEYSSLELIKPLRGTIDELEKIIVSNLVDNKSLNSVVFQDNQEYFYKIESILEEKGYLSETNQWVSSKANVVRLYKYLSSKGVFRKSRNKPHLKILRFFEDRYNVELGKKLIKPNQIEQLKPEKKLLDILNSVQ
ncbi:hypothetical protein [Pseudofulvibacter geojedonensis]|uniref:Uncharacterized protein n=1 Tax=Pseudofulvibacter geojedonensis TaxID=1123758 RepID=A0ABW3I1Y5_9FLAO